ncbi:MAG TPA: hypothetical protein VGI86_14935 [Acidimicrobiia bacterium]
MPPNTASRNATDEHGLTVTHMLTAVVAVGVALVALFLAIRPSPAGHTTATPATVAPALQPVLHALQHDVSDTVHAILLDTDGCGHAHGQRAVVSFLADGSAPERASWYVEVHGGATQLVRRDCRNGSMVASGVVTAVAGRPLVACNPSCGRFQQIRFSYDGPNGLTSVVAYRSGRAR